jgi:hypothetical protein
VKERRLQQDLMMAHRSIRGGGGETIKEGELVIFIFLKDRSTRKSGTRQAANSSSLMAQYVRTDTSCVENRKLKDKIKGKCTGVNKVEKCAKKVKTGCLLPAYCDVLETTPQVTIRDAKMLQADRHRSSLL